jgi:hypothetical protein
MPLSKYPKPDEIVRLEYCKNDPCINPIKIQEANTPSTGADASKYGISRNTSPNIISIAYPKSYEEYLSDAVLHQNFNEVRSVYASGGITSDRVSSKAFYYACQRSNVKIIWFMIDQGQRVKKDDVQCLVEQIYRQNLEIRRLGNIETPKKAKSKKTLLDKIKSHLKCYTITDLHDSIVKGQSDRVREMLFPSDEAQSTLEKPIFTKADLTNELSFAISSGNTDIIWDLINNGADAHTRKHLLALTDKITELDLKLRPMRRKEKARHREQRKKKQKLEQRQAQLEALMSPEEKEAMETAKINKNIMGYSCYFKNASTVATLEECKIVKQYWKLYHNTYANARDFHSCGQDGQIVSNKGYVIAKDFWDTHQIILKKTNYAEPPERHICST